MNQPNSIRRTCGVASFRLTPQERERVDRVAASLGLGVSAYARRAVLASAARAGSDVLAGRAAQARLLAQWTVQIGLLADEVRALRKADGCIDPSAVHELADRIHACHQAVLAMFGGRRA